MTLNRLNDIIVAMLQKIKQTPISVILALIVVALWLAVWAVVNPISFIGMVLSVVFGLSIVQIFIYFFMDDRL